MALFRNFQYALDVLAIRTRMLFGSYLPKLELILADMTGKTVIITGGNTGIGLELATKLASMNASVFLACRNQQKAEVARQEIVNLHPAAQVKALSLDQASLQSVKNFAANWTGGKIDILINNAGLGHVGKDEEYTADGLEALYQINFLSSFLLTKLLESHLAPNGRVIFTSSNGAFYGSINDSFALERIVNEVEPGFHTAASSAPVSQRYFNNKLMQIAFAKSLQDHFARDPLNRRLALSYDPGVTATTFFDKMQYSFTEDPAYVISEWLKSKTGVSVEQGAATGVYLSVTNDVSVTEQYKGGFWSGCMHRLTPVRCFVSRQFHVLADQYIGRFLYPGEARQAVDEVVGRCASYLDVRMRDCSWLCRRVLLRSKTFDPRRAVLHTWSVAWSSKYSLIRLVVKSEIRSRPMPGRTRLSFSR